MYILYNQIWLKRSSNKGAFSHWRAAVFVYIFRIDWDQCLEKKRRSIWRSSLPTPRAVSFIQRTLRSFSKCGYKTQTVSKYHAASRAHLTCISNDVCSSIQSPTRTQQFTCKRVRPASLRPTSSLTFHSTVLGQKLGFLYPAVTHTKKLQQNIYLHAVYRLSFWSHSFHVGRSSFNDIVRSFFFEPKSPIFIHSPYSRMRVMVFNARSNVISQHWKLHAISPPVINFSRVSTIWINAVSFE